MLGGWLGPLGFARTLKAGSSSNGLILSAHPERMHSSAVMHQHLNSRDPVLIIGEEDCSS